MTDLARFQRTIVDDTGAIIASPTVTVRDQVSNALVSLFSDRAGASALSNPFTGTTEGLAAFHVAGGAYKVRATSGSFTAEWTWVGIGTASEYDFADFEDYVDDAVLLDDGHVLANLSGLSANGTSESISDVFDYIFDDAQGSILYRGASGWVHLSPGTAGQILRTGGASANVSWIDGNLSEFSHKDADQSITSTTTFTNITELSFPVEANAVYRFRATVIVYAGAGGFRMTVNGPASPVRVDFAGVGLQSSVTSYGNSLTNSTSTVNALTAVQGVIHNGANAGTVTLQFRQDSANAAATTVKSGSWIEWQEIS
jgi:hypothetical protein